MRAFKDQLYVSIADDGGGAVKFSRMCVKPGGCDNGNAYGLITQLEGRRLNHISADGTNDNGSIGLLGIDTMWEYDNDGSGSNPSQLYLASGGSTNGASLPSSAGSTRDGGILRSVLGDSTTNSTPDACASAGACNAVWEDVTPTRSAWLSYMSIPLPEDAVNGGDWDALVPANTLTPAILAVPAMRTAPNGDLYLIRNACSNVTVRSVSNGDFVANNRQTCTAGAEIPQLWMLPAGSTASPSGAADWRLVAGTMGTNRTDMSENAACTAAVNQCDTENTHITLLEVSGNFLYIGFDNETYGVNLWSINLATVASGTVPTQADFTPASSFGLGDAARFRRIFSSSTINFNGINYLHLVAGNGTGAGAVFKAANN